MASIGTSTGRGIVNTCGAAQLYNQVSVGLITAELGPDPRGCNNIDPFQTTVRGLASYTIPKIDVLVSATIRSQPPVQLTASWQVPNSVILASLGHLPAGALATGTTTLQLLPNSDPNKLYADQRRNQIDMRLAKILRFRNMRANIGVDVINLFNANTALSYTSTYAFSTGTAATANGGSWQQPSTIMAPRYARFSMTLDF